MIILVHLRKIIYIGSSEWHHQKKKSSIRHNVCLRYDKILICTQIFNLRTKYFLRYEFSFRNNVVRFRVYKCFLGFSMVWHHILFGKKYFGCVIWTMMTGHEARTFRNKRIYISIFNQIKLTTDLRGDYVGLQNWVSLNISFWNSEVSKLKFDIVQYLWKF